MDSYTKSIANINYLDTTTVLILVILGLSILLIVIIFLLYGKNIKKRYKLKLFKKYAKERELNENQIKILCKYSKYLNRDPFLALEFKAPFEKVINEYINKEPDFEQELIKDMRKKLGFDVVPEMMPLVVTKDIDLFQAGKLITPENLTYDIVLFDKDERYMYWIVVGDYDYINVSKGEVVRISFTRKNDAIYNTHLPIIDIIEENDKTILKFPHTFDLVRIQRREYPRIKVNIDAFVRRIDYDKKITKNRLLKWHYVRIDNLSAGGVRICIPHEKRIELNIYTNHRIQIKFELNSREIKVEGIVVNINEKKNNICYGIKFTDVPKEILEFISKFVQKEQQKLLKVVKGKRNAS
ncbi:MAG: PilZ domain-containing protein [Aquificae bacterium]|nr:PilZ domain-containing protein [Aquificota bacterium]